MQVVLKRLFMSKINRPPLSLSKLARFMAGKVRRRGSGGGGTGALWGRGAVRLWPSTKPVFWGDCSWVMLGGRWGWLGGDVLGVWWAEPGRPAWMGRGGERWCTAAERLERLGLDRARELAAWSRSSRVWSGRGRSGCWSCSRSRPSLAAAAQSRLRRFLGQNGALRAASATAVDCSVPASAARRSSSRVSEGWPWAWPRRDTAAGVLDHAGPTLGRAGPRWPTCALCSGAVNERRWLPLPGTPLLLAGGQDCGAGGDYHRRRAAVRGAAGRSSAVWGPLAVWGTSAAQRSLTEFLG